jgi:hypothetical protein
VRLAMIEDRMRAHDKQCPQISIAHLRDAAQLLLPPDEFCLGVRPRKAANSRGPEKAETSSMLAAIAEAVTGPKPGMVIRLSSPRAIAAMVRSLRAIS